MYLLTVNSEHHCIEILDHNLTIIRMNRRKKPIVAHKRAQSRYISVQSVLLIVHTCSKSKSVSLFALNFFIKSINTGCFSAERFISS